MEQGSHDGGDGAGSAPIDAAPRDEKEQFSRDEKEKGNRAFQSGDYQAATTHFSAALRAQPDSAILFSNRLVSPS